MPEIVFNTRGAESIDKAHDKADARAKKTQKNYQQTAREAQNLGRIEQRIIRDTETARERYNRKLNETRQALAGHARETEIVRRAETQLKLEYARSSDANKKLLEQRKAAAKEAIKEQKDLKTVTQETTEGFDTAFDPDRLTRFVAGFASVTGAIALVREGLQQIEADGQAAADRSVSALGSGGELAQLFSTQKEYQSALAEARDLVRRGIFKPDQEGEAMEYVFDMMSAGYSDEDRAFLAEIGEARHIRPEGLKVAAQSLRKQQRLFGGEEKAGTIRDVYNKNLAGGVLTESNVQQFARATLQFGQAGRALNFGHAEQLAALAIAEREAKDVEVAATQLDSLFQAADKIGFKGGSIGALLDYIGGMELAGGNLYEILGRKEAVKGYRSLATNRDLFRSETARIDAAPEADLLATQMTFSDSDPRQRAAKLRVAAEGARASQLSDRRSELENLHEALRTEVRNSIEGRGADFRAFMTDKAFGLSDLLGTEETDLRGYLRRDGSMEPISDELREAIQDYFSRQDEAPKKLEEIKRQNDQARSDRQEANRLLAQLARKPFGLVAGPG